MKFKIARDALLKPLQAVSGVVEKRQALPVLSNILLRVGDGQVTLTGTDLEVELITQVELIEGDPGEVTLPARKFVDICRALPDGAELSVSVEEGKAVIRSGRGRFSLATLPASEFPAIEGMGAAAEFTVRQGDLKHLIDRTQFCMANQDVRYYLNGLLLEIASGKLRAVATDGHRLALCEVDSGIGVADKQQVIVPRKGVNELGRLLADDVAPCLIKVNNNHIRVELGTTTLTSKLIDGRFPDYERVLPREAEHKVVADREPLRQALARASILSNEKYRGVRLQLEHGRVRAVVNNPEQEEAEEEIIVDYDGAAFEIGFNVSYLLDALSVISEAQVEFSMADANSSALIRGVEDTSSRYVVMPMRL